MRLPMVRACMALPCALLVKDPHLICHSLAMILSGRKRCRCIALVWP